MSERELSKFEWVVGAAAMVAFIGFCIYCVVQISRALAVSLATYMVREIWLDRLLQGGATLALMLFALVIPEMKTKLPRIYYMGVFASGSVAIWLAIDQVVAMMRATDSNNIGSKEAAVLLAAMIIFAKAVEACRGKFGAVTAAAPAGEAK